MQELNFHLTITTAVLLFFISANAQNVPTTLEEMVGNDKVELQYVSSFEKTTLGGWMQGTSMPHPRYYGGSVMYTRNDTSWLYVLGGDTTGGGVATATCLKYNVITDTWEYIAPLPEPLRTNATAILGDKIYTMGGFNAPFPSPAVASFYEYDINVNSWTQMPDLPDPMFFAGAEGFEDSLIYIIGGIQDNVVTDDLWRHNAVLFNINKMSFREATPMPEGTASFGHSLVGNSLFIQAGLKSTTELWDFTLKGDIDVTDRATINWSQGANYPLAVYAQYSYPISDDEIYSGGGSTTTGFNPIANAYGYKIGTNTYEIEPDLPYSQMAVYGGVNYRSFPNPSGVLRVAISGGITTGPALTNQTWIYTEIIQSINIEGGTVPEEYSLMQNYPNPFNPNTTIRFSIPVVSNVTLEVFNAVGEKIGVLVSEELSAGTYNYDWKVKGLTSGIYFYRLSTENYSESKKMILLK
jgi:N-acetylneuraminic acid mutarotase